ncbi:hypothetical protein QVD17_32080 [Tagetes erecta]|uniref:Uncharacterized protein n=1 Tax=Tagetes erecta TaxID=13708 RepID=A0AAD8K877_TARER|nr:hypothetical protein QVD17_32080 [Tagetes erecta]
MIPIRGALMVGKRRTLNVVLFFVLFFHASVFLTVFRVFISPFFNSIQTSKPTKVMLVSGISVHLFRAAANTPMLVVS